MPMVVAMAKAMPMTMMMMVVAVVVMMMMVVAVIVGATEGLEISKQAPASTFVVHLARQEGVQHQLL